VHFHTHDTSGIAAASVFAAVTAGVDAVDGALDAMSGFTSQPNLGSMVEALRHGPRDSGVSPENLRALSGYWEQVRHGYLPFESELRAGASDVYVHGMPGGQVTNLREQARSMGIGDPRWPEVAQTYAQVNEMFGDIIKVTPTSKVVGDMALMMVSSGLTREAVLDPAVDVAFPESVVQLFHGDLGQPVGGFPPALQAKILKGEKPLTVRPGEILPPTDLEQARSSARAATGRELSDHDLCSYLMYPKVYVDYMRDRQQFGPVSSIPTRNFFYGMYPGEEISVDIERGKTLIIRFITVSEAREDGLRTAFFELNGLPRSVKIADRSKKVLKAPRRKAESSNDKHIPAPMPGIVSGVHVAAQSRIAKGDVLVTVEAMKMETAVRAERDGVVSDVLVEAGAQIDAKDLLLILA